MDKHSDVAAGQALHVLEVVGNAIVGGMETWVERFIERMPPERVRFTVLCPADGAFARRLRGLGMEVLIVPMADDPSWSSIQMATALVQSAGVDLLHAHLPRAHALAGIVGRLTSRPVLATVHGRQPTVLDLEVHRAVQSHLSVVCRPSYYSALGLGVSPELLSCETNGVDTAVFRPQRPAASALRDSLGLAPSTVLVGFVGRLSPEKGPDVFLRMAMLLQGRQPDAHCVVVGDGPMQAELARLAGQLGLRQTHFLGLRDDMPALYNELDVVVSSSHSEAMPLALMEAMACGLPLVATRVGGVPDLIEHGETGWLAGPGDFNDLAGRCAALVADEALRRRMGARGRARAVEHFDLQACVDRVGRLMLRLAGSRGEPALPAQVAGVSATA
ncbi:glycosyltransferase [Pelomonas sp. Root1444]|uniref:glycosyltransferase n=1 Tax=Pelomonas sp. Root1444 TaxID=1736464 RepID=UPI0007033C82|nr:glycosyltransferase [Pelomonas sp. Root1444]KQY79725.1 hypothetical protein ASD35_10160 [Pelomonas sp. Root1444]